jgi:hypothetical protein
MATPHRFRFYRAGGVDQVQLRDGSDLRALGTLDEKLWVAVAMPVKGVHVDPKTLSALDLDKDGRVRVPEVRKTVEWLDGALYNLDLLFTAGSELPLDQIKDPALQASARRILSNLGKSDGKSIAVADVADTAKVFAATRFNGDGVIPADSAEDEPTKKVIEDIITCFGSVPDRSGKPGVDKARIESFFSEVKAVAAWREKDGAATRPMGDKTAAAQAALEAVRAKIEDYFVRTRLAAFDPRAAAALSGSDADLAALAPLMLGDSPEPLRRLPLARIEAGRSLPLGDGVNPAWSAELLTFGTECMKPIVGNKSALSADDFAAIKTKLAPHQAWLAEKPATAVEKLGLDRVSEIAAAGAEAKVLALLAEDVALEAESAQIESVERLLLLRRDFSDVLHNFVNFSHFYAHKGAAFQAGTLILDGRSCRLCLEVSDVGKHAALAPMAGAFLAYCECTRAGGEKLTIAAAFTDGDADHLTLGRNGLFIDRKGQDWDATITRIVTNPISVRDAFWSPYKRLTRMIEEQVGKRAAAADAEANAKLTKTATAVTTADKEDPAAAKAPPPEKKKDEEKKIDVGTVAAIGVAVGGIGAMFTGILAAFFGLGLWMPLGLLAVMLAISGPSMLLAWLKLRQRNLGPLLDANGWAINGRARINVPFGGALTDVARLPKNAERQMNDPYAEKRTPWGLYLFVIALAVLAATWYVGRLDRFLPEPARASTLLHR